MKPASEIIKDQRALRIAFKHTFETPDGRRVLDELKREAGFHKDIFSANASKTAHAVGKRAMVVYIETMMREEEND